MARLQISIQFFLLVAVLVAIASAEKCQLQAPPPASDSLTELFPCTFYNKGFANIWASDHEIVADDQAHVKIMLDASSGTGFKTKTTYVYGFFSAALKLPANDYTAGVITTFYTSNAEIYPDQHDEIDFEFLGRIPGEEYILQTNVYANGSTNIGREQRLRLWFDPTADYHDYSILWTSNHIVQYIDDIPIREYPNMALKGQYPLKPMYVYATIWDGSDWATDGGKYKANYSYAPFVAAYSNFILNGCATQQPPSTGCTCASEFSSVVPPKLTSQQRLALQWVQQKYIIYDYCQDKNRYPTPLPECAPLPKPIHVQPPPPDQYHHLHVEL